MRWMKSISDEHIKNSHLHESRCESNATRWSVTTRNLCGFCCCCLEWIITIMMIMKMMMTDKEAEVFIFFWWWNVRFRCQDRRSAWVLEFSGVTDWRHWLICLHHRTEVGKKKHCKCTRRYVNTTVIYLFSQYDDISLSRSFAFLILTKPKKLNYARYTRTHWIFLITLVIAIVKFKWNFYFFFEFLKNYSCRIVVLMQLNGRKKLENS